MKIQTFKVLKTWTVSERRSPWFGSHDSGIVNIPADEYTPEQIKEWTDAGILELVSEKESEEQVASAETGTAGTMNAEGGQIGAQV